MRKNSLARIKANNKYNKKAYKQFNVKLKPFQMEILENYCNKYNFSKNNFAVLAFKEKIERDTGKSFDDFLAEKSNEKGNK